MRVEDAGTLVVDWKSDVLDGRDPAELVAEGYSTQRIVYALAALRAGAERVEVAHCFLERPDEPALAVYAAADADAPRSASSSSWRAGWSRGASSRRTSRMPGCARTARAGPRSACTRWSSHCAPPNSVRAAVGGS